MMAAKPLDQLCRRAFSNNLSVVHDCQAITKAFSFVHVMRGQQDSAAGFLKGANDVPKLAAALRIEPRGRFVEEKHPWRSDQRGRHREPLPLPAGKFPDPRIRFLIELQGFQNFGCRSRLAIEAGKKRDGFAHR